MGDAGASEPPIFRRIVCGVDGTPATSRSDHVLRILLNFPTSLAVARARGSAASVRSKDAFAAEREQERGAEAPRSTPNYGAGIAARSGARAVEGPRVKRSPLTTVTHARPTIGEMNRE
jgi:hypothetical protein